MIYRKQHAAIFRLLLVLLVFPSTAEAGNMAVADADRPPAANGRLVVKYTSSVTRSAQSVLASRSRFEDVTGSASLDRLNTELGVIAARPLAMKRGNLDTARAAVVYRDSHAAVRARFPERAARAPVGAEAPDLSNVYVIEIDPELDVYEAARRYAADPAVVYARPDYEVHVNFVPNDPYYSSFGTWGQSYEDLWGLHRTNAASAWDVATGQGVVVAVTDTGVDLTHPDLQANLWTNPGEIDGNGIDDDGNGFVDDIVGWDFSSDDNDPMDGSGHGTHVAGTIAAVGNNGLGIAGMGWGARVMVLQGLDRFGNGFGSNMVAAILYAADNGADVINASWSAFVGPTDPEDEVDIITEAVATARALGVVVVAAAANDGTDLRKGSYASWWVPAGGEGVVTVGASNSDDEIASWSNSGIGLSVSAPGVDVLSLRGDDSTEVGGQPVGPNYLRLSGTSMATPHVSGLAAVLLSAIPTLTADEVRWHIELNADQPGYPGYEGKAWNPYHGWGRIDAARVFDAPPVTTRIDGHLLPQHAFPDEVITRPFAEPLRLEITTPDPTSWTVTAPAWLQVSPTAGTTGSRISIAYDTTGMSPGPQTETLDFDVPTATDGGASVAADLYVHRDERAGPEIVVAEPAFWRGSLGVVSNGVGSLVVWRENSRRILAVHINAAGNPGPPVLLWEPETTFGGPVGGPLVATDGDGYIVAWSFWECPTKPCNSHSSYRGAILRIDASGQPVDDAPIVILRKRLIKAIDFDGEAYSILIEKDGRASKQSHYVHRLGRDGTLRNKARRIGTYPIGSSTAFACATGTCLLAWEERTGEVSSGGFFIREVKSVQIVGDRVVSRAPVKGPNDLFLGQPSSDGTNFLMRGVRWQRCGSGAVETICRRDVLAARVAPDGSLLDAEPFQVNNNSPFHTLHTRLTRGGGRSSFDGTHYLVPFRLGAYSGNVDVPSLLFLARVRPDGTVVDGEDEGLLVRSGWKPLPLGPQVAVDALHSLVVFSERDENFEDTIRAVPMLARSAPAVFASAPIGAIGSLAVDEGEFLKLALSAPGLDPESTVFVATGLPIGAHLDHATGLFAWRPNGAQSGSYSVTFEADDGVVTASEEVTIGLGEASLSIGGTVRLAGDGSPLAGVGLRLIGIRKLKLVGYTDVYGNFRFDDLEPGRRYKVRLERQTRKEYRMHPSSLLVEPGVTDVRDVEIELVVK